MLGYDVNPDHVAAARTAAARARVEFADFFDKDWSRVLHSLDDPILLIGNPPWVTNAAVGGLGGRNLPTKSNFQRFAGLDAITGKSNFDISEWMLTRLLGLISGRTAVLAMLCKTVVARKVMRHAWMRRHEIQRSAIYRIDAAKHFGAAVEACLLVCILEPGASSAECNVFECLAAEQQPTSTFALRGERRLRTWGRSPNVATSSVHLPCSGVPASSTIARRSWN